MHSPATERVYFGDFELNDLLKSIRLSQYHINEAYRNFQETLKLPKLETISPEEIDTKVEDISSRLATKNSLIDNVEGNMKRIDIEKIVKFHLGLYSHQRKEVEQAYNAFDVDINYFRNKVTKKAIKLLTQIQNEYQALFRYEIEMSNDPIFGDLIRDLMKEWRVNKAY